MAITFDLSVHLSDFSKISRARKALLLLIANNLNSEFFNSERLRLLFICTHNSRRSQLAEIIADLLSSHYDLPIDAYSGGTEATEIYFRVIEALETFGIELLPIENEVSTHYVLADKPSKKYFSKCYDVKDNPQKDFFAFMVCDDAYEACPVVNGSKYKFPLKYKDPKAYDDSDEVKEAYTNKVIEIGTEINFIFQMLHKYRLSK